MADMTRKRVLSGRRLVGDFFRRRERKSASTDRSCTSSRMMCVKGKTPRSGGGSPSSPDPLALFTRGASQLSIQPVVQ